MRALVLAGGRGARLRPYTAILPRSMMPVGDRPVLDVIIRQLERQGFGGVTIATDYLAEIVEAFFRDGQDYGIPIDYCQELAPLSSDAPLLVINGNVLTDLDYAALMRRHAATGAAATVAAITRDVQVSLGVLHFGDERRPDRLTAYEEKPHLEFEVSMGVCAFTPDALRYLHAGERPDFQLLLRRLLEAGEPVCAYRSDCYWLDLGRHDDYDQAVEEFESMRHRLLACDPRG